MRGQAKRSVIIGSGMIAAVHARAVRAAGGQLHGVVGSSAARSAEAAAAWGADHIYPDLNSTLADDDVDIVHICTPNALHVRQTEAALSAGKHVVCEKPLGVSVFEAERVVRLASVVNRVVAVPLVYRYHPVVAEIRALRQAGEFGPWTLLHGSYLQDWMLPAGAANWRVDPTVGGPSRAFADIGSHWCDLVEWVAGVSFTEVSALFTTMHPVRPTTPSRTFTGTKGNGAAPGAMQAVHTEDAAVMMLRTADGVLGNLTVSQVSAGRKNRLWFELDGARGSAVFDQENPESAWLGYTDGVRLFVRDPSVGSEAQRRLSLLPAGHPQGYADCFAAFIGDVHRAVDGDVTDMLPTAVDGLRSVEVIRAVVESSGSHAWTAIEHSLTAEAAR